MFAIGDKEWPGISKLAEEAGEVLQVIGKLMGTRGEINHWDGTNLKERLEDELGDLIAAFEFVYKHCNLDVQRIVDRSYKKEKLFDEWHAAGCPPKEDSK